MVGDLLDGITHIGIWPGMSKEYRPTDWEVGFMHVPRNEDRLRAFGAAHRAG